VSPTQGAELQIHVVWQNDHPLQESVHLQLQNASGIPVSEAFTSQEGVGLFHSVRAGNYRLRVDGVNIVDTTTENITVYRNEAVHLEYVRVVPRDGRQDGAGPGGMISASDFNVPDKARKEMDKAKEAMDKGDMVTATQHLDKAIQIYPEYARAWNNLGVIRMKADDRAGAKVAWEHAVAADDKLSAALLNLARIAIADKQPLEAEKLIQKALATEPGNLTALMLMCTAQATNGEWAAALVNARKIHAAPDHQHFADAHRIAAEALLQLHQPSDALSEYQAYLSEYPESPHADEVRETITKIQAHMQARGNN
jgi:Tfp pilus assembly protein PilF